MVLEDKRKEKKFGFCLSSFGGSQATVMVLEVMASPVGI